MRQRLIASLLAIALGCEGRQGPSNSDGAIADASQGDGSSDAGFPQASPLGATVTVAGVRFGVWAPNADAVAVVGDFNQWDEAANPMTRDDNGNWWANVAEAKAGHGYGFAVSRGADRAIKADPRGLAMSNSAGHSIVVDPQSFTWAAANYQTPPWHEWVVYEMHIGSFVDAPGGGPGTFDSAITRLDDLAELGINALELMPVAEFAGDFSWGYNPGAPFAVESAYGGPEGLVRFIDAAHARGLAVVIDVVHNHWGPSDLATWCFDLQCLGAGGIYHYTDNRLESGWGPRPDFGRREVRDYIADNAKLWLQTYRADGLRWDSTINIRSSSAGENAEGWQVLQRINDETNASEPWKMQIAEDLQNNDWLVRGTADGGAGFDSQWGANFFHPVDDALIEASDSARDINAVAAAIYHGDTVSRVVYTESHDEVANGKKRMPDMIDPSNPASLAARKRSTLGAALVMTSPGLPMLFQGQEFLEDEWFRDTDPLEWARASTYAGIRTLYRDLIALRRNASGHTRGLSGHQTQIHLVDNTAKFIAFHRWHQGGAGDDTMVVANFAGQAVSRTVGFPTCGNWQIRFNGDANAYSADFGNVGGTAVNATPSPADGKPCSANVNVGAWAALVLSQ